MADDDRAPDGKRITDVAFWGAINVAGHASVKMKPPAALVSYIQVATSSSNRPSSARQVSAAGSGSSSGICSVVFLSQKPLRTPTFPFVNSKEEPEAVGMTNLEVFGQPMQEKRILRLSQQLRREGAWDLRD